MELWHFAILKSSSTLHAAHATINYSLLHTHHKCQKFSLCQHMHAWAPWITLEIGISCCARKLGNDEAHHVRAPKMMDEQPPSRKCDHPHDKCVFNNIYIYDIATTLPYCWCFRGTQCNKAISATTFICLARLLIVNFPCSVTIITHKPIIICHSFLNRFWSLWVHNVPNIVTHQVGFHLESNHPSNISLHGLLGRITYQTLFPQLTWISFKIQSSTTTLVAYS